VKVKFLHYAERCRELAFGYGKKLLVSWPWKASLFGSLQAINDEDDILMPCPEL